MTPVSPPLITNISISSATACTLVDLFEQQKQFSFLEKLMFTRGLIHALYQLHQRRCIHAYIGLDTIQLIKDQYYNHHFAGFSASPYSRSFSDQYPRGGSLCYKPPEFLSVYETSIPPEHKEKIDPWSVGCVLYMICCDDVLGQWASYLTPCQQSVLEWQKNKTEETKKQMVEKVRELHAFIQIQRTKLSNNVRNPLCALIFGLLHPNPEIRFSAKGAYEISQNLSVQHFIHIDEN